MIPASFDLHGHDETALDAFEHIVTALGIPWDGRETARLLGRVAATHKRDIAWGVAVSTTIYLEQVRGEDRYQIVVTTSCASCQRSPSEALLMSALFREAAEIGSFVEAVVRGRTWASTAKGW